MTLAKNLFLILVSTVVTLGIAEGALRIKNLNMKNYDIEMWKYAKELKTEDPLLGHIHIPNKSATLQGVEIKLNSLGMRSHEPMKNPKRRVLFLGSSITMGWGVEQVDSLCDVIEKKINKDGQHSEVLNGGIGNYNTSRYVELFFQKFTDLRPTDIVVHYFINDAEILPLGGGNIFLRNSQLAVTLWIAFQRIRATGSKGLVEHYSEVYDPNSDGYVKMSKSLEKLSHYALENNINLYMAMSPDIHFLIDYPFKSQHEQMRKFAQSLNYKFIDLLPALEGVKFEDVQTIKGDAHPNARGHEIMAETIYQAIITQ